MSVFRIYFDRRLRNVVVEEPKHTFQGPFCRDYKSVASAGAYSLLLEQLFDFGVDCHSEDISDHGYDVARIEDRHLMDIVERLNRLRKISGTDLGPEITIHHFGIGQYEFLETYVFDNSMGEASENKQLVLVRRSDSESWYCVVGSSAHRYGAGGTAWARKLELADGNILRIFATEDWTGAAFVGHSGPILEFDLSRFKLLPTSEEIWWRFDLYVPDGELEKFIVERRNEDGELVRELTVERNGSFLGGGLELEWPKDGGDEPLYRFPSIRW